MLAVVDEGVPASVIAASLYERFESRDGEEGPSAVDEHERGPRPGNRVIVLFGATSDLAKRKLLPGLVHLDSAGLLSKDYRIIGSARRSSAMTDEQFRAHARQAAATFGITKPTDPSWPSFAERLSFAAAEPDDTTALVEAVKRAEEIGGPVRRLYHLAVPPAAPPTCRVWEQPRM